MYPLSNQAPSPAIPHHVIVDELNLRHLHSYTSQGGCHWECCVSRFFQNEPCTVSNPTHTPPGLPPIYTVQPTLTANFFLDRSHPDGPPPALPSTQNPPTGCQIREVRGNNVKMSKCSSSSNLKHKLCTLLQTAYRGPQESRTRIDLGIRVLLHKENLPNAPRT